MTPSMHKVLVAIDALTKDTEVRPVASRDRRRVGRGSPQRLSAGVRQVIAAPRREHSRKPDGVHDRVRKLVAGPYLEMFGRAQREGWTVCGNETTKFGEAA